MTRFKALTFFLTLLLTVAIPATPGPGNSPLAQARQLIEQNKFTNALDLLTKAAAAPHPGDETLYLRGYVLYRLNRLPDARRQLESVVKSPATRLESSYILARIAETEGLRAEAIQRLVPCAEAKPPVQDSVNRLARLYWEIGELDKSQSWTERALTTTPWDGSLHYRLARIYQIKGQTANAASEFKQSSNLKSADSSGVRKLMECSEALSTNDRAAAMRIRDEFLHQPDLDPDLLLALGTAFATAGAPDQSVDLYASAASRDPRLFQAHFNLGLAMLNLNKPEAAIQPLTDSLKLAPASKQANAALGVAYVMQERFSDAVPLLELARAADRQDNKVAGLLSVAYYRSGAPAHAIPLLRELIQHSTQDAKVYFLLIDCLNATAQEQQALDVSTQAAQRFPQLAKAWLSNAQQLARLGNYHQAGPSFSKALSLAPDDVDAMLGLAEAQQKDGEYQASLETYRRALARDGDLTAALGAARSLASLGNFADARALLEQSLASASNNSQLHLELSRIYARLGEKDLSAEQARIGQRLRAQESPASQ